MAARKWRHQAVFVHTKGLIKVTCGCGKQSVKFQTQDEADAWHTAHTKLIERGRKL